METIIFTFLIMMLIFKLNSRLAIENLALRQQLAVMKKSIRRPKIRRRDRLFWVILSRLWFGWENALILVQPGTVIRWHRKGFKLYWKFKSQKPGRPSVDIKISFTSLAVVAFCIPILAWLNKRNPDSTSVYIVIGSVMWVAMLKSGVHATLTGVIVAMFIPLKSKTNANYSPLKNMERDLHSAVAFFILPIFAFANAGISFSGVGIEQVLHSVPLGIALGLFAGKQLGIFGFFWLVIKLKLTSLPSGMSWSSLYGTAALCGIGFTMSLFIGSLTFEETGINLMFDERLGIILGSFASGIIGYMLLRASLSSNNRINSD